MDGPDIKYTNQRVEILACLKGNTSHPTVEQVYREVRKRLTRISKATVYQNLRFLAERGIIQEVNIKGISRFEPNTAAHHHLICKSCGAIVDFEAKELTAYAMKTARKLHGIAIETASTNFYGCCKSCTEGG
jgi:Fur family transcriptional regulator, ferric uptake regulator